MAVSHPGVSESAWAGCVARGIQKRVFFHAIPRPACLFATLLSPALTRIRTPLVIPPPLSCWLQTAPKCGGGKIGQSPNPCRSTSTRILNFVCDHRSLLHDCLIERRSSTSTHTRPAYHSHRQHGRQPGPGRHSLARYVLSSADEAYPWHLLPHQTDHKDG